MRPSTTIRRGGVTSAFLALILLILVGLAVWFLVPGVRGFLGGIPGATAPSTATGAAPAAAVHYGSVTAVRSKDGLPTFVLIDSSGLTVGQQVRIERNGQAIATATVESIAGPTVTARVLTGATPLVGDHACAP